MNKGELLAIAAAARANRDYTQLVTALEMLIQAEPTGIEGAAWLREKARVEENDLADLERAFDSWTAVSKLAPGDAEAFEALARIAEMRG